MSLILGLKFKSILSAGLYINSSKLCLGAMHTNHVIAYRATPSGGDREMVSSKKVD